MAEQISSIAPEIPNITETEARPSLETGNITGGGNAPENRVPVIPENSGDATLAQEEANIPQPASLDEVVGVEPSRPPVLGGDAGDSAITENFILDKLSNR
jgi:hypothetical protein